MAGIHERDQLAGGMFKAFHLKCHIKSLVIKKQCFQCLTCSVNNHLSQTVHCRRDHLPSFNFCLFRNILHDQNPLQLNQEVEVPTVLNTHKTRMEHHFKLQMEWKRAGQIRRVEISNTKWPFKKTINTFQLTHYFYCRYPFICYIPGHIFKLSVGASCCIFCVYTISQKKTKSNVSGTS